MIFGAAIGAAGAWLWPYSVFEPSPRPGVSLVIAPITAGLVMHAYGVWSEERGRHPSYLATFWGGALFAFAMAGTRRWILSA